jgi:hypothetical protein
VVSSGFSGRTFTCHTGSLGFNLYQLHFELASCGFYKGFHGFYVGLCFLDLVVKHFLQFLLCIR